MTGERKSLGAYVGLTSASNQKYPDAAEVSGGSFTFLPINERINFSEETQSRALSHLLQEAHDTLHECTAVLSARDCAEVAALMQRIREALAAKPALPNPDAEMWRTIAEDAQRRLTECRLERRHLIDCQTVARIIERAEIAPVIKQRLILEISEGARSTNSQKREGEDE